MCMTSFSDMHSGQLLGRCAGNVSHCFVILLNVSVVNTNVALRALKAV